jgi:mono/diheme cytochrome c family protein
MKKSYLCAVTAAFLLGACGGDKPAANDSAKPDTAAALPTTAAPAPSATDTAAAPATAPSVSPGKSTVPPAPAAAVTSPVKPATAAKPASAPASQPAATKPAAVQPATQPAPQAVPQAAPAKPAAPAQAAAVVASTPVVDPMTGKPLYEANCQKCHGANGTPVKSMKAKFDRLMPFDASFFSKRSDDSVVTVLMKGKGETMKSFTDKLSHPEMIAVAAYIRTLAKK